MPEAASLADAIKRQLNVTPNMIAGDGGVYDIAVDDTVVYSKPQGAPFPKPAEVIKAIRKHSESQV